VCGLKDGGCSETFQKGAIYWSPATAARVVLAAVKAPWSAQGGIDGAAGYPVTDSFCGLANGGCYQGFQGGSFYYSPAGGGHLVRGAILAKWGSLRWENGVLGYPTGDEVCGLTGGGCSQAFQNGAIYWSPSTGALVVSGDVGVAWKARGGAASDLGYPLSDTYCGLTAGGCFQIFQFGSIYWSTGTGGHLVRGGIRDRWGATGWEGGSLGYPLTDENCGLVNGGCFEKFERGSIYWTPVTGAHSVSGAIRDAWAGQGYEGGAWGYPTDEPASTGSGTVQHFTGGTATFDATAGTVTFR